MIFIFSDFRKITHCCRLALFLWFQFQKIPTISFSKNHRDLKNEHFIGKICKYFTFTLKNNRQKDKLGHPFYNYFRPQKWAKLFLSWSKKNKMSFSFSFWINKGTHFAIRANLYKCFIPNFVADSRVTGKHLRGPAPSEKATVQSEIHSFIQHNVIDREKTTFTFTHLVIHNDTNYTIFRSIFWGNPQGQVFNFLNFIKPPLQPSTLPVFPPFF